MPPGIEVEIGARWGIEQSVAAAREWLLLVGPSPDLEAELEDYDPVKHREVADRFAEEQERLRTLRRSEGWHKGERAARVAQAEAFVEY